MSEKHSDLIDIKKRIYEEGKIEVLLSAMGCQRVKNQSNRIEAQLPPSFNSNNTRSVQVYNTEYLQSKVRSKGISEIDIFGLTSYIVHGKKSPSGIKENTYEAKKWICDQLGYKIQYQRQLAFDVNDKTRNDPLKWLKTLQSKRKKVFEYKDNPVYDDIILEQFYINPVQKYIDEGISADMQREFEVGIDIFSERYIFPIHNQYGDIISVKGRTMDEDYKSKDIKKFFYFYNYNKSIEFYNFHRALIHIMSRKEVIIFEGEKSCWLSTQYDRPNCIGIGGDDISRQQVKMIKELGVEIKIIVAMDKDKDIEEVKKQALKFGKNRMVYAIWDADDLLSKEKKDSPVDRGVEVYNELYDDHTKYRIQ